MEIGIIGRKSAKCMLAALLAAGAGLAAPAATYKVELDRPGGLYGCGETAVFTVTLLSTNNLSSAKSPCMRLDNFGTSVLTNLPFEVTSTGRASATRGRRRAAVSGSACADSTARSRGRRSTCRPLRTRWATLKGRNSGWPKIVENNSSTPERRAAAEKWAPYFDGANFASRITCPVRVAVGFSDTTCPPCAVYAAYNEIKVKDKAIGNGIGMTHSCSGRFYSEFGQWVKSSSL